MFETVAIQGEVGSFSEEAAIHLVEGEPRIGSFRHFEEVFAAVGGGEADACVIPLENSLTGSIHRNYDLLRRNRLKIAREHYLPIKHNLIALPESRWEEIRMVVSHPVALGQCERFFEEHPWIEMQSSYDTSGALRDVLEKGDPAWAAIAGDRAQEVFGGKILRRGIQDNEANYTRFVLLTRDLIRGEDSSKTSVLFSFRNVPGALFRSLGVFASREIDLVKIESRPIHGRPWEYLFYLDFLGNLEESAVQSALAELEEITDLFVILGSYPRDENVAKRSI